MCSVLLQHCHIGLPCMNKKTWYPITRYCLLNSPAPLPPLFRPRRRRRPHPWTLHFAFCGSGLQITNYCGEEAAWHLGVDVLLGLVARDGPFCTSWAVDTHRKAVRGSLNAVPEGAPFSFLPTTCMPDHEQVQENLDKGMQHAVNSLASTTGVPG